MSKDIDVSLWIVFREFYGNVPLQEVLGGYFVVVNEILHAEFAEFKGKVLSYIRTTRCLVKEIALLKIFCRLGCSQKNMHGGVAYIDVLSY